MTTRKTDGSRALDALVAIADYIREVGWAPSLRDIADHMGLRSPSTVLFHVAFLRDQGLIVTGKAGESRALRITTSGHAALELRKLIASGKSGENAHA